MSDFNLAPLGRIPSQHVTERIIAGYIDHDPGDEDPDEYPGRIAIVAQGAYGGRLMARPSRIPAAIRTVDAVLDAVDKARPPP